MKVADLLLMTDEEFHTDYKNSPVKQAKLGGRGGIEWRR